MHFHEFFENGQVLPGMLASSGGVRHGRGGLHRSAPPTVKHTAQEAGSELCEILKFRSFLQSKSVNRVCKLLQLLGKFVPKSPTGASPLKPNGALLSQTPGQYSSPK